MTKPTYTLTRRAFWASFVMAWGVIVACIAAMLSGNEQAVPMATALATPMVMLIAALLGIHRAFGSMDMKTMASAPPPGDPQ
jgi:peptidoglycan/LPS O-acetylase OafA/YrhL